MTPVAAPEMFTALPVPTRSEPQVLPTPPSTWQVLRILAQLAWRRCRNQLTVSFAALARRKKTAASGSPRPATPGKHRTGYWLIVMLFGFIMMGSTQGCALVERLSTHGQPRLEAAPAQDQPKQEGRQRTAKEKAPQSEHSEKSFESGTLWPKPPHDRLLVSVLGLVLLLIGLGQVTMLLSSGKQDLGSDDWDLEWLFTFPVPARTLFLARLLQYAVVGQIQMMYWFVVGPFLAGIYWSAGYGWWSLPVALGATACTAFLGAGVYLVLEIWLQKRLSPSHRKNVQATLVLLGGCLILLVGVVCASDTLDALLLKAAHWVPLVVLANPFSLPALLCAQGTVPLAAGVALAGLGIGVPLGAVQAAAWLVRDGLLTSPGAYQGNRQKVETSKHAGVFRGIIGKELRLLLRDRAFLVQTLILPLLMGVYFLLLHWNAALSLLQDTQHASGIAFSLGLYVLCFSGFLVLASEGKSLWLLYTFPRALHIILLQKTLLWGGFAMLYGLGVFVLAAVLGMPVDGHTLVAAVIALIGILIYSCVAAALGVLTTNPLGAVVERQLRWGPLMVYMLLAALFAGALYSPLFWVKVSQIVLAAFLAAALWQKVQDQLPYLLEPTEAPPHRLSLADGVIAAMAFLTVQALVFAVLSASQLQLGTQWLIADLSAGGVVTLAALFFLRKVPDLFSSTGLRTTALERPTLRGVLVPGVVAGLAAALFGIAYLLVLNQIDALRELKGNLVGHSPWQDPALFAVFVLVAPLFEEFIFRGLIYQGLQRSIRPLFAVLASATIFALVHPPISVLPVFVLGIATALSFQRSRLLLTPILTHTVYNTIIVLANLML